VPELSATTDRQDHMSDVPQSCAEVGGDGHKRDRPGQAFAARREVIARIDAPNKTLPSAARNNHGVAESPGDGAGAAGFANAETAPAR